LFLFFMGEDQEDEILKIPEKDRFGFNARRHIEILDVELNDPNSRCCKGCWHVVECCICQIFVNLKVDIQPKIFIYTHFKEYGRMTNTGKFLKDSIPSVRIIYCGDNDGEEYLRNLIENEYDHTFILYPANDALTFQEYTQQKGETNLKNFNVVVLDGTWTQVKMLKKKRLPTIQNIKLQGNKETISKMRKETSKDRVSTAEALLLLLEEMGEEMTEIEKIWEVFKKKLISADLQTGKVKGRPPMQQRNKDNVD